MQYWEKWERRNGYLMISRREIFNLGDREQALPNPILHLAYIHQAKNLRSKVIKADANGNWWLVYDDDGKELGYFPRDLFPVLGSGPATSVDWGRGDSQSHNCTSSNGQWAFPR